MKKWILLLRTTFLTVSAIGQNAENHSGFYGKLSKHLELFFRVLTATYLLATSKIIHFS